MNKLDKIKLALLAMQRHSWEQGVTIQAFLEQGDEDVVIALAKEAAYRRDENGRTALMGDGEGPTDTCSPGEAMIYAYEKTGDADIKAALDALLTRVLKKAPRNPDGIIYHVLNRPEIWVDSVYMLPPYLVAAGLPEMAMQHLDAYFSMLYDPKMRLMSHMWDDEQKIYPRRAFWGVGNGWTVAGLARVIDALPESMAAERQTLIERSRALIDSLLTYMRPDGYFHDVVDDPATFIETNLSQMLAYAIFRGVKSGYLPNERLIDACKLRAAAHAKVDRFGLVQDVCGAPHFDKAGVAPEGNAFFLLMEAAAEKALR
jgi:rhamnogalacturonyl hydrolase YesR